MIESGLKQWIKDCEGYNEHPYMDNVGKMTIGYGRNLDTNGINRGEADLMFENDFNRSVSELKQYDWYRSQSYDVQCALINMCFNLGIYGLLEFQHMIDSLKAHDYQKAADDALESKWASQVGHRAIEVTDLMRQG